MAKQPKTMPVEKKQTARQLLDATGIDAICDMIEDDLSYQDIADKLGIDKRRIMEWLEDPHYSARARESRRLAAQTNDRLALKCIHELPKDATPAQIAAMREEVQLRKWRAAKRDPGVYGDKITHSGDAENPIAILTGEQLDARIAALQSKITS